jgi:hypothetical protein
MLNIGLSHVLCLFSIWLGAIVAASFPQAGLNRSYHRVLDWTRMTQIWALHSRLEKQPTDRRRRHHYLRDGALDTVGLLPPR